MKKTKKIITLVAITTLLLTSCNFGSSTPNVLQTYDYSKMNLVQLKEPEEGQEMAVITTSLGTIKVVLYPQYAPNTVDNFKNRIKDGFYTNRSIFAVENNIYFLTGSSNEAGTEGLTNDGKPIVNEYSVDLWPFKGAMLAYNGQTGYGDSRFFIINSINIPAEDEKQLREFKNKEGVEILPKELIDAFVEKGSVPGLAGIYTVYGQTIEGFDVIEKITNVAVDKDKNGKPLEDIFIEKIELEKYTSKK